MFMFTNWHLRIDGSHSKLTNLPTKKWAAILTDRVYEIFAFPVGEILPSSAIKFQCISLATYKFVRMIPESLGPTPAYIPDYCNLDKRPIN